jgi:hypothetical protein
MLGHQFGQHLILGLDLLGQILDPLLLSLVVAAALLLEGRRSILEELNLPPVEDRRLQIQFFAQVRYRYVLLSWFSLKWREGRFPLASKFRPLGGDFQGMRVYRSDGIWGGAEKRSFRSCKHRVDEPARLTLGMVASPRSPLPFHPAESLYASRRG